MATIVLVHGAWHGGWCWRNVVPSLRAAGHDVYAPTLTGLGERSHLLSPAIGLGTHIQDVVNTLDFEDLRDVVLVGHSYAGMVVTGVAERVRSRLAQIVYLDAYVPRRGESLADQMAPERRTLFERQIHDAGEGYRLQPPSLEFFGITDPADAAWCRSRLTDQPLQTYLDALADVDQAAMLPRTYVWAKQFYGFAHVAERLRYDPTWCFQEIDTGHDLMITAPGALAALLIEAASRVRPPASSTG